MEAELVNIGGICDAALGPVCVEFMPSFGGPALEINQTGCNDNIVTAKVSPEGSGLADADAGLGLLTFCRFQDLYEKLMTPGGPCRSAAGHNCKSTVPINLIQCGMNNNQLVVDGTNRFNTSQSSTPDNEQPFLLVSGGCLGHPLSVAGTGKISCTSDSCLASGLAHENIVTQADCRVLSCGGHQPCLDDAMDTSSSAPATHNAPFCEKPSNEFSTCGASPLSIAQRPVPVPPQSLGAHIIALSSTAAGVAVLVPVTCAVLGTVACVLRHKKGRHQAASPDQETMEMDRLACDTQAAEGDSAPAAAAPSRLAALKRWICAQSAAEPDEDECLHEEKHIYEEVDDVLGPDRQGGSLPGQPGQPVQLDPQGYAQLDPAKRQEPAKYDTVDSGMAPARRQQPQPYEVPMATTAAPESTVPDNPSYAQLKSAVDETAGHDTDDAPVVPRQPAP